MSLGSEHFLIISLHFDISGFIKRVFPSAMAAAVNRQAANCFFSGVINDSVDTAMLSDMQTALFKSD